VDAGAVGVSIGRTRTASDITDDIVVNQHRAFGRIDGRQDDAIANIAMNEIVVDKQVELVEAGGIGRTAIGLAQRRGVKLYGAASHVVVDMVPAYLNVAGVGGEINRVVLLGRLDPEGPNVVHVVSKKGNVAAKGCDKAP